MIDKVLKYEIKIVVFDLNSIFEYFNIEQSEAALLYQKYKSFGKGIFLAMFFLIFEKNCLKSHRMRFC